MQMKKDEMVVFGQFSKMDTAVLEELFNKAVTGDVTSEFRLGLYSYNMTPAVADEQVRKRMRGQAVALMSDASMRGNLDARKMMIDLARQGVPEATDFMENMNERGGYPAP